MATIRGRSSISGGFDHPVIQKRYSTPSVPGCTECSTPLISVRRRSTSAEGGEKWKKGPFGVRYTDYPSWNSRYVPLDPDDGTCAVLRRDRREREGGYRLGEPVMAHYDRRLRPRGLRLEERRYSSEGRAKPGYRGCANDSRTETGPADTGQGIGYEEPFRTAPNRDRTRGPFPVQTV